MLDKCPAVNKHDYMVITGNWRVDPTVGLLLASIALMYVAARALVDAAVAGNAGRPLARAVGYWVPIAMLAVATFIFGQPSAAVQLIFTTSVASLTLVLGTSLLANDGPVASDQHRKIWVFILPVAILLLLAGFQSRLTWLTGIVLLVQGLTLWFIWPGAFNTRLGHASETDTAANKNSEKNGKSLRSLKMLQTAFALGLVAVACWMAVKGVMTPGLAPRVSPAMRMAIIIGPGLCIVMTGAGAQFAQQKLIGTVISTQVYIVLLNICFLLPLLVFGSYIKPLVMDQAGVMTGYTPGHLSVVDDVPVEAGADLTADAKNEKDTEDVENVVSALTTGQIAPASGLPFPILAWRIDTVVLVLMGLFLLPVSMGMYAPGRLEGLLALGLFVVYLMTTAVFSVMR